MEAIDNETIRNWLISKFTEIEKRITLVLEQLSDDQVNWCPNESSNSVANLVVHISGNIHERIGKGINKLDFIRDRDQEFEKINMKQLELLELVKKSFKELIDTTSHISEERLHETQLVRNKPKSNLDILLQSATHFSEHMGQILYIAKICLNEEYTTTSIPKRTNK